MAKMIPSVIGCEATKGEILVYDLLEEKLTNDYVAFSEIRVNGRNSDFVIVQRSLGFVVLEVKDYLISTIVEANKNKFIILTKDGVFSTKNPLEQARGNAFLISDELKKSKILKQNNGLYKGNLCFSYGYAVVFTNITREEYYKKVSAYAIAEEYLIFKDDLNRIKDNNIEIEKLLKYCKNNNNFSYRELDELQVKEVVEIINGGPIIKEKHINKRSKEIKQNKDNEETVESKKTNNNDDRVISNNDEHVINNIDEKKHKNKIWLIIPICLTIGISLFLFNSINKTVSGKIQSIYEYDNGAILLEMETTDSIKEVYINKSLDLDGHNFILDSTYEFSGEIVEYDNVDQMQPQDIDDIEFENYNDIIPAYVTRVIDGDTIEVKIDGEEFKVRLIGINCPEKGESQYEVVRQKVENQILNTTVYLEKDVSNTDKYDRLLRYVWIEEPDNYSNDEVKEKMLNAHLLIYDHTDVSTWKPDVKYVEYFNKIDY